METKHIIQLLNEQLSNLENYTEILLNYQGSLIGNNIDSMEQSLVNQEKLLRIIKSGEERILAEVKTFAEKNSLNMINHGILELITVLEGKEVEDYDELVNLHNSLRAAVITVVAVNDKNRVLVEQARGFMKELIKNLNSTNRSRILDRKV